MSIDKENTLSANKFAVICIRCLIINKMMNLLIKSYIFIHENAERDARKFA
jgi:hypothetical protein